MNLGWDFCETPLGNTRPMYQLHHLDRVPTPASIVWLGDTTSNRTNWGDIPGGGTGRMTGAFNPTINRQVGTGTAACCT